MNLQHLNRLLFVCVCLCASWQVAGGVELSQALTDCRALESAVARLDCYDRLADKHTTMDDRKESPGKSEPDEPPADVPAEADISPEALFGKDPVEVRESVQKATGSTEIERMRALVTSVRYSATGKAIIELDNAQVWTQIDNTRLRLAAYDEVVIRRASLGSFMLTKAGSKTSMRVKRIS